MTTEKITKREVLEAIKAEAQTKDVIGGIAAEVVIDYVDTTIAQLDHKAEKAKETAAKKRAAGDELRAVVKAALTDELQAIDAIAATVAETEEDITKSKVTARLTQLVKAKEAYKEQISVDGRKIMAYRIFNPATDLATEVETDAE